MITSIPTSNYAHEARLNRTSETNLVAVNNTNAIYDKLCNLDKFFGPKDVIVVNDSAVIPGSFQAIHYPSNTPIEFRLVRFLGTSKNNFKKWEAIAYGKGNWTTPTENRTNPPIMNTGDLLITQDLLAEITTISGTSRRMLTIKFLEQDSKLLDKIYTYGKLIQYSYLFKELKLWDHQTIFSTYPVSLEPSSSVFQLNWNVIFRLQRKGVKIIPITHAISISNTGIDEIDKMLPLPERYWLSQQSADALNESLEEQKNIIAFGTSATRSLESIMQHHTRFIPGSENVDLVITKDFPLQVTNGILTGMHMIKESHINLLQAFLPLNRIKGEYYKAINKNFLWHEYGDSMLIKQF